MSDVTPPPPVNPFIKMKVAAKRAATFGLVAIVLAILAGILAWFAWKEAHDVTTQIKFYAGQLSQQTTTSTKKVENTISGFQTKLNTLQNNFDNIQNKFNQLSSIGVQAHNQRALSEVSYLIHTANLQLVISHNPNSALQLMILANKQLKQISSPNVIALKHSVAKAIAALKKAPKLDITELLAQLNQVKEDVQKLPVFPTQQPTTSQPTDAKKTTLIPWYKKLGHNLGGLKQLVIIRHDQKRIKPLLSAQQLMFLKQNVQLRISQAEWAVLYRNLSLYQQSLAHAKEMLEEHYPNQEAMTDTLNDIEALSKIDISPALPDLSNTLKILNTTSIHAAAVSNTPMPHPAGAQQ